MTKVEADTLYGTLSLLVLQALSDGPLHGLEISHRIHDEAGDALKIDEGALYPALHRLERGRPGHRRVGNLQQAPAGEILQPHREGQAAAATRGSALAQARQRGRLGAPRTDCLGRLSTTAC